MAILPSLMLKCGKHDLPFTIGIAKLASLPVLIPPALRMPAIALHQHLVQAHFSSSANVKGFCQSFDQA
jgi:hypothetical protein